MDNVSADRGNGITVILCDFNSKELKNIRASMNPGKGHTINDGIIERINQQYSREQNPPSI